MKKISKIISFLVIVMVLITTATTVIAAPGTTYTPGNMDGNSNTNTEGIINIGNSIVNILSTIGVVVSVVILIVLGIKYMLGSAEEKAEYKKTLLPYFIGAALIFAASTIATIIFNFMSSI